MIQQCDFNVEALDMITLVTVVIVNLGSGRKCHYLSFAVTSLTARAAVFAAASCTQHFIFTYFAMRRNWAGSLLSIDFIVEFNLSLCTMLHEPQANRHISPPVHLWYLDSMTNQSCTHLKMPAKYTANTLACKQSHTVQVDTEQM